MRLLHRPWLTLYIEIFYWVELLGVVMYCPQYFHPFNSLTHIRNYLCLVKRCPSLLPTPVESIEFLRKCFVHLEFYLFSVECFQYTVLGVNAFTDGNAVDAKTNATDNTNATNPILICWLDIG